jgi:D-inositol-3-phosphate glycosyltransferase
MAPTPHHVSLLTAGKDPHYALGLLSALTARGIRVDFVANDAMKSAPAAGHPLVNYLNLRGDQRREAGLWTKTTRVLRYYRGLMRYAAGPSSKLFHILWFNKFEWFDNTLLILFYRMLGKKLVYTAHNVSTASRDQRTNRLNEWSLRFLYRHVDHVFVHSENMKSELVSLFGLELDRVTALRFPVNDVTPRSGLSRLEARRKLGVNGEDRVLLFFGNIAPYKGLEDAVEALGLLRDEWGEKVRLLIAGPIKNAATYWREIEALVGKSGLQANVVAHPELIPEEAVGDYFAASDVLLLPYRRVYQSGVLFLSYNQGLPVIAADVGGLAEGVVEGETGFLCRPEDPRDLAEKTVKYFESPLYRDLESRRSQLIDFVQKEHSWAAVAERYDRVYGELSGEERGGGFGIRDSDGGPGKQRLCSVEREREIKKGG